MKIKTLGKQKKNSIVFIILAILLIIVGFYTIKGFLFITAIIDNSQTNDELTYLRLDEDLTLIGTNNVEYSPIYSVANAYIYQLPKGIDYTYHCSDGLPRTIKAEGILTTVQVLEFNQVVYYQEEKVC